MCAQNSWGMNPSPNSPRPRPIPSFIIVVWGCVKRCVLLHVQVRSVSGCVIMCQACVEPVSTCFITCVKTCVILEGKNFRFDTCFDTWGSGGKGRIIRRQRRTAVVEWLRRPPSLRLDQRFDSQWSALNLCLI